MTSLSHVRPDSVAARAQLKAHDFLLKVNDFNTWGASNEDVVTALQARDLTLLMSYKQPTVRARRVHLSLGHPRRRSLSSWHILFLYSDKNGNSNCFTFTRCKIIAPVLTCMYNCSLGMTVKTDSRKNGEQFAPHSHVYVAALVADGLAANSGLVQGDIIIAINDNLTAPLSHFQLISLIQELNDIDLLLMEPALPNDDMQATYDLELLVQEDKLFANHVAFTRRVAGSTGNDIAVEHRCDKPSITAIPFLAKIDHQLLIRLEREEILRQKAMYERNQWDTLVLMSHQLKLESDKAILAADEKQAAQQLAADQVIAQKTADKLASDAAAKRATFALLAKRADKVIQIEIEKNEKKVIEAVVQAAILEAARQVVMKRADWEEQEQTRRRASEALRIGFEESARSRIAAEVT